MRPEHKRRQRYMCDNYSMFVIIVFMLTLPCYSDELIKTCACQRKKSEQFLILVVTIIDVELLSSMKQRRRMKNKIDCIFSYEHKCVTFSWSSSSVSSHTETNQTRILLNCCISMKFVLLKLKLIRLDFSDSFFSLK
jgi:hypothetical protein